ncbi:enoyl-CoA hydratase/isomerase family protein [Variovorax sp. Sphag1AA]|uniref:enoyl-CoA hydratase/isomerase family protein n=1 Tax=Variovorax sp. Sphag1AA TaxID=2587027 RepID=UPI0016138204|nr:enoyl-CoA hydratase/isomerase family protein [Variovorax sp. Sphag1AA]MBB3176652.1 2-(1,2-epoxy-1,2-dihydrophenyl)acetyl-CoA isomerase [Variovorax sp. Sphag1AA]
MPADVISLREAQLSIEDGIAEFTHTRPERRNPLSLDLRADYIEMLDRVESDRSVRALIITGSGGSFCAGGDLRSLQERLQSDDPEINSPDAMRRRLMAGHAWFERLRNLEMPVIAAVDGPAAGAGMSIALAADFILASTRASFSMSFVKVGLLPDMAAFHTLPRIVGMAVAKDLMLTARRIGADEAERLGIVHSLHDAADLPAQARRFARRFAGASRAALAMTKRLLHKSFETPYAAMAELEANGQAVASATPEHVAAVRRFLAGEPSSFDWDREAAA